MNNVSIIPNGLWVTNTTSPNLKEVKDLLQEPRHTKNKPVKFIRLQLTTAPTAPTTQAEFLRQLDNLSNIEENV